MAETMERNVILVMISVTAAAGGDHSGTGHATCMCIHVNRLITVVCISLMLVIGFTGEQEPFRVVAVHEVV
jgi:hypothetical protein